MIRSIEIKGLRGIREGRLDDLTPLVVLVGPNNSGKSTVLDALLIGAGRMITNGILTAIERRSGIDQKARWLVPQPTCFPAHIECIVHTELNARTVRLTIDRNEADKNTTVTGTTHFLNEYVDHVDSERIRIRIGEEVNISPITISDSAGGMAYSKTVLKDDSIPEVYLVDPEMGSRLTPLPELYTKVSEQGRRKEARTIISGLLSGVEDILILTEGERPILSLDFESGSIPVALAGEGVQSLMRTVLELASCPNGVVLLEEPEVHQHPGAIRQTARAIWAAVRRDIQVIISTHSIELIDLLLGEVQGQEELDKMSVYGLMLKDGCLRSSRTQGDDIAFARTTIGDDLR